MMSAAIQKQSKRVIRKLMLEVLSSLSEIQAEVIREGPLTEAQFGLITDCASEAVAPLKSLSNLAAVCEFGEATLDDVSKATRKVL